MVSQMEEDSSAVKKKRKELRALEINRKDVDESHVSLEMAKKAMSRTF